jgi:prophage regulatory protein
LQVEVGIKRRWAVRFIRTRQVLEMIGVGRTTLWKMVQEGTFPRPVRITERNSGYLLEAVEEWMQLRTQGLPWQPKGRQLSLHGTSRRGGAKLVAARQAGAPQESVR